MGRTRHSAGRPSRHFHGVLIGHDMRPEAVRIDARDAAEPIAERREQRARDQRHEQQEPQGEALRRGLEDEVSLAKVGGDKR